MLLEVKSILGKKHHGYAKGYNDALKKIDSEYFILINSDVEVSNGWIDTIIKLMDQNNRIA